MSFKFFMSMMVFVKQSGELIFPQHASSTNRVEMVHMRTGYNGWFLITLTIRHFSERILIGAKININLPTHGWRDKEKHAQSWLNLWTFIKQPVARSHVLNVIFQDAGVLFFFIFYLLCYLFFFQYSYILMRSDNNDPRSTFFGGHFLSTHGQW